MIIDLSRHRKDYFELPEPAAILRQYIEKEKEKETPITINDVRQLAREQKVTVATKEGDLDGLLAGTYTQDSMAAVERIADAEGLIIIPGNYRINAAEARKVVVYSLDTLVLLDSAAVRQKILGKAQKGKLSATAKQEHEWHPEKVMGNAFNLLHEQKEEDTERTLSCYAWWGKDRHRRIVSLYRAIQGAELRAFQNVSAYKLLIPTFRKELRTKKKAGTDVELSADEQKERQEKIDRYEKYIRRTNIGTYLKQMETDFTDLIEPVMREFAYETGEMMRVPSRSRPGQTYRVKLTDVPVLAAEDPLSYSLVWEMAGNCYCEDKSERSDRRKKAPGKGCREDFFCPHEIAALHDVRKKYEKDNKNIHSLPFVIPTKEMMDFVDKLRYQAVMVVKGESGRHSKHGLNHTEIENLLWKKVIADGYERCFTTNIERFKEEKYDPQLDLVKFVA
ncbi:hypothetical protein HYX14_00235 [Candidatus Woesearchaeota archaeon]|nr:hypothetical protein [Candidatus Woesearchaeota archaeon]